MVAQGVVRVGDDFAHQRDGAMSDFVAGSHHVFAHDPEEEELDAGEEPDGDDQRGKSHWERSVRKEIADDVEARDQQRDAGSRETQELDQADGKPGKGEEAVVGEAQQFAERVLRRVRRSGPRARIPRPLAGIRPTPAGRERSGFARAA